MMVTKNVRFYLFAFAIAVAFGLSGYKIIVLKSEHDELTDTYPNLERLIAIYSFLSWRSPEQLPPEIKEDSEWGGKTFTLECNNITWNDGSKFNSGDLFSCFAEEIKEHNHFDGEEVSVLRVTSNNDFWYKFTWESLFGYEFDIEISPTSYNKLYDLKNELETDEACYEELDGHDNASDFCSFNIYLIEISGLTASGSVAFLVSDGYLTWLSDGSVDRVDEWVVYIDNDEPLRIGAINKFIQLASRKMQYTETDLKMVIPKLESDWINKDKVFVEGVIEELETLPELEKVSKLLKGEY